MRKSRIDIKTYNLLADRYDISADEVRRIVVSFFDTLQSEAKSLPFDNDTRIYSKNKFNEYVNVQSIPFVGRIGPVYSRYISWRRNESETLGQQLKSSFKVESRKQKADELAKQILKGHNCSVEKNGKYKKIWIVQTDGKKLARQVIPIKNED